MDTKVIIKNSIGIAIVLGVVFLSQQSFLKQAVEKFSSPLLKEAATYYKNSYISKIGDRLKSTLYPKISGGAEDVKEQSDALKETISEQKDTIEKKSTEGIKKYIAEKVVKILDIQLPAEYCEK